MNARHSFQAVMQAGLAEMSRIDQVLAKIRGRTVARLIVIVLTMAAMAMLWWSLTQRLPLMHEAESTIQRMLAEQNEVIRLRQTWSQEEAEAVAAQAEKAGKSLIVGYEGVAVQIEKLKTMAAGHGLALQYALSESSATAFEATEEASIVPLRLQITAVDQHGAFAAMLAFVRQVSEQAERMDVVSFAMRGNEQGVLQADLGLDLWTRLVGDGVLLGDG
ncbi:MAG: hypothetical protein R8K46_07585 [Mariprofundaceae bacterium]